MGLAPSRNGENPRKSGVAKVPVPVFSQPRSVRNGSSLFPIKNIVRDGFPHDVVWNFSSEWERR